MRTRVAKASVLLALATILACSSEPPTDPPLQAEPDPPAAWIWQDGPLGQQPWEAESFAAAQRRDCPVLLYLAAPGAEGLFAEDNAWLADQLVLIRVDPFRRPDIARRYATGGWPALVLLDPKGRIIAQGTDIPPPQTTLFIRRLVDHYGSQRDLIERKLRRPPPRAGAPYSVEVDPVYRAIAATFDSLHGGFGQGPKFPETEVLRFLLAYHARYPDRGAWKMARRSLDALLASPMLDTEAGGISAFSFTPDWRAPVREKEGADQAGLTMALLAAVPYGGEAYGQAARALMDYAAEDLFDDELGVFKGRQLQRPDGTWWTDPAVYADRNALLIRACLRQAAHSRTPGPIRLARQAAAFVIEQGLDHRGAVYHYWRDGTGFIPGLLEDQVLTAAALLDLYDLSGEDRFREKAAAIMGFMEKNLLETSLPAFFDRPPIYGLESHLERPYFPYRSGPLPAANPVAAQLYLRLGQIQRAGRILGAGPLDGNPGRASSTHARMLLEYAADQTNQP
ncbi:MAG: DUF255 domain-containing protein [Candidatus Latescibacteria bacterium]|nr:DUF255 domain-containing protein [Candidatus Latescibacterota bacterium]